MEPLIASNRPRLGNTSGRRINYVPCLEKNWEKNKAINHYKIKVGQPIAAAYTGLEQL